MRHAATSMKEARRSVDPNLIQNVFNIPESEKFQQVTKRKFQSKIGRYILLEPGDKLSIILRGGRM